MKDAVIYLFQVSNVVHVLRGRRCKSIVDLGSGDGRVVNSLAASRSLIGKTDINADLSWTFFFYIDVGELAKDSKRVSTENWNFQSVTLLYRS